MPLADLSFVYLVSISLEIFTQKICLFNCTDHPSTSDPEFCFCPTTRVHAGHSSCPVFDERFLEKRKAYSVYQVIPTQAVLRSVYTSSFIYHFLSHICLQDRNS
jgi:hypothetical protein